MINKLILSALILTTFFQKGFASGTPINSDIKEVTVFLHGAQVTRQAQFSLTAGTSELVFEGLSNDIDENSIEVKGSGSGVIMSVNYRINYIRLKQKSSDEKHLQGMLDSAKLKLEGIQNEIASLTQQLDLMAANYKLGVNEKSNFIEDIDDWADLYKKRTTDIRNKISRLRIAERDAVSNMKNVQEQVDATQAANKVPSGEVIVKVSAANSGVVYFTLRYFVQNAGWSPVYSLRAQNITDPVKLDYDAVVRQKTGEDWNDVKLMLATINPNLSGNKPELSPWYLSIYVPRPIYKNRLKFGRTKEVTDAAPMYQQSMQKDERRLDDKDSQTMSTIADYTTTTQGQLNTTFDIAIKYSIPSDDNGQQVRVQQYNLPAVYEYISIPKFDKDAFLLAKVGGWEQFNLIPGPANLFFDGTYVGKSDINPVITGDTLALSFGRDKKISIDRIKIKELAKKQLLGGTKTETYSYDIVVKNVKNVPVRITIEDQIPLVTDKDIKVEALELSHGFLDEETGKVLWRGVLKPNEVYKMRLTYSVKYPKGKIIMGLN